MKGKLEDLKPVRNIDKKIKKLLPKEFDIFDIIVKGKRIIIDMRELLSISNVQNKQLIISSMNKVSSRCWYFGKVLSLLEEKCNSLEEDFKIWLSRKMTEVTDESSEKAKERIVMVHHSGRYKDFKNEMRQYSLYKRQAEIAYKTLEKSIELIRSIGAMTREEGKNKQVDVGKDTEDF